MSSISTDRATQRYLRRLKGALADVPRPERESILQDVRDHIDEALAQGRDPERILAALGEPRLVAEASRSELDPRARGGVRNPATVLWGVTVALGVLAAVVVSFFLRNPEGLSPEATSVPQGRLSSLVDAYGPGAAVLTLLPALACAGVVLVPDGARRWLMMLIAALLSVLVFTGPFDAGLFLVPMAITAWMGAVIGYASTVTAPRAEALVMRILGALLLVVPVVLVLAGLMVGSFGAAQVPLLLWAVFSVLLAAGYAANSRAAHWVTLAYGLLVLGVAVVDAGILVATLWVGGGVILAMGLYGLLRLPLRSALRVPEAGGEQS